MMQFLKNNKMLVLGGVVVIAAAFVYFTFLSPDDAGVPEVTSTGASNSPVTQDLLLSLTTLHVISLDNSIFRSDVFLSLSDFGVQIPEEVVGRRNPFAPVGSQ